MEHNSHIAAVSIGTSLGGPQALCQIFKELPASFPTPIFVVQHMSKGFTSGFVDSLKEHINMKIKLAENGEKALPGCIYIAPDDLHLEINPYHTIQLVDAPPESGSKPSVGRLFRSMAKTYNKNAIGIILTGMGRDGVEDLLLMKQAGAITIAQDAESSLMFGMPKEAIAIGAATHIVPLNQIPAIVQFIVKQVR